MAVRCCFREGRQLSPCDALRLVGPPVSIKCHRMEIQASEVHDMELELLEALWRHVKTSGTQGKRAQCVREESGLGGVQEQYARTM